MEIKWTEGFSIATAIDKDTIIITANRAGLLSLSQQFKDLAEQEGSMHYHLDEHNALEEGSVGLIIEKDDDL